MLISSHLGILMCIYPNFVHFNNFLTFGYNFSFWNWKLLQKRLELDYDNGIWFETLFQRIRLTRPNYRHFIYMCLQEQEEECHIFVAAIVVHIQSLMLSIHSQTRIPTHHSLLVKPYLICHHALTSRQVLYILFFYFYFSTLYDIFILLDQRANTAIPSSSLSLSGTINVSNLCTNWKLYKHYRILSI